jgi:hypothetical protein
VAPLQRRMRQPRGAAAASPPPRPALVELSGPSEHSRSGVSGRLVARSPSGLSQARGVFRRTAGLGRPSTTYTPVSRGLRPSFRARSRRPPPDRPCGLHARRASPGVSCPSAHHGSAGPLARGSQPPLRSAPGVSTPSAASSPRALPGLFHPGALLGFSLQGFDPPGPPVPPSEGPSPPRRWAAAGSATSGARDRAIVARSAASSPRLVVPGVRPPQHWLRASRRAIPSWASSSLGLSRPPPHRPRFPGGHPPSSFRTGIGLAPRSRPGSAGSSTATDLARLRESSGPFEVLPLL